MSARLVKMTSNSRAAATFVVACKRYFVATTTPHYAGNKPSPGSREGSKTKTSQTPPKKEDENNKKPTVAKKEGEQVKKAPVSKPEEKASGKKLDVKK